MPNPTTSTTSQTTTKVTTTTSKTTTKSPTATTPTTTISTTSPTTTTHTPTTTSATTTTSMTTVATTTAMTRDDSAIINPALQPTIPPIFPEPAQSTISSETPTTQQQTSIATNNSDVFSAVFPIQPQPEQPEIDSLYLNESSLDAAIWVEEPTATYPDMTKPTTTIHRVTKAINSSADDYSGYNPAQNATNPVTMDRRTLSEFMAPIMQSFHEQFKQHLEAQHENELAREIRQMYCQVSVLRRLQAVTLSQTNGLLAASVLELPTCSRLQALTKN
ncbi:hypothetical protein DAPPUDRAFT_123286 [Daphnia pulex]|uniref:Uncharacterized protein n=1 Tax=Daphnia pulex TaxID=6669 RepID=E9I5N3_DAPPU|nr:hypothetical protein DAPPUDRAFT_123286 [Daphnia pulex]|eukprot:EFX60697.1 hypothetical protein DAPPUDRAFT_123286 [Daphnia pulex]